MSRWSKIVSWLSCILVSANLIGCATFDSAFGKKMRKATATDPAVEIVCLWQPGEGRDPDGLPCKGFMGQVMFLSSKSSAPVVIEGDVRVYLFDDQGTEKENTKPLRQFDFDNGSWAIHLTSTSYGPTYTVFIPYVRRGVTNARCSLYVRLKPKVGPVICSEFTDMQLNGPKKLSTGEEAKPLSNEEINKDSVDAMVGSLMKTTTIAMGPNPQAMQPAVAAGTSPQSVHPAVAAKAETASSQIQQATHQVVAAPANDIPAAPAKESADADRIRRLESMMETMMAKLLEQQNAASVKPAAAPRIRPEPEVADPLPASTETDVGIQKSSRRMRVRRSDDDLPVRTSPKRRVHPLEMDDAPSSRRLEEDADLPGSASEDMFDSARETPAAPRKPSAWRDRKASE